MVARSYRFLVTVTIEGNTDTLPSPYELAEEIATLVQDPENHDFAVGVRAIETQDFRPQVNHDGPPRTRDAKDYL